MKNKTILAGIVSLSLLLPAVNFAATKTGSPPKVKTVQTVNVNINHADAKTLVTLKDIGKKKAADIIAYRTKNGAFKSVSDLTQVKGISQRIVNDNKGHLEV